MLFDLKGKRKRTVQVTYLGLAILMGAGLVLFGIGSSVNGGLGDLFKGGNGSNKANETIQKKIDAAQKTLQTQPKNQAAMTVLIRDHYQLATAKGDANGNFTKDSRPDLLAATAAWKRYDAAVDKPNPDVAQTVIQAYEGLASMDIAGGGNATNDWGGAAGAAEVIAGARPTANNYARLVYYATLAGQKRRVDLASAQAVRVAPKSQKKQAKALVANAKAQAAQVQQQSSQNGQSGTATPSPSG